MVKNGGSVEAHQWSVATQSWTKIGDVVNAVSQSQKQTYEGIEYDYVFDVDVHEGAPPLKLPYNVSENPYAAAQRFLDKNELEMGYIDQVVKFIETNTGGVQLGTGSGTLDPYCNHPSQPLSFPRTNRCQHLRDISPVPQTRILPLRQHKSPSLPHRQSRQDVSSLTSPTSPSNKETCP
jgi:hypothetical protein